MSLVALAAVAVSTGAMAQVTISGNLNINAVNNDKTTTQKTSTDAATTDKTVGTGSKEGWTASQIAFSGTEDLGGGLTASFFVAQRLNATASQALGGGRDTFLGLSGGFGSVRIGQFIPASAAGFHAFTGARTTNQAGSVYGLLTSGENVFGNASDKSGSFERQTAVIQYTTPSFNGFTVNASYGKNGVDKSGVAGDGNTTQHGLSFAYSAGPLAVGGGTNQRKVNTELVAGSAATGFCADDDGDTVATSTAATSCGSGATLMVINAGTDEEAAASHKAKLNWLGASYDLGVARVMVAHVRRTTDTTEAGTATVRATDIKTNAVGVHVPMGAFTLAASTYSGKNNKAANDSSDDLKLSGHQLSVTYALSKRTTIYAATGENKTKRAGTNTGETVKRTSHAVGLMHSF